MKQICQGVDDIAKCRCSANLTLVRIVIHKNPSSVVNIPDKADVWFCPKHFQIIREAQK